MKFTEQKPSDVRKCLDLGNGLLVNPSLDARPSDDVRFNISHHFTLDTEPIDSETLSKPRLPLEVAYFHLCQNWQAAPVSSGRTSQVQT
jgi:hypothetical protein